MEMTKEEKSFFDLVESWDDANIDLALQMLKGNKELKAAAEKRYAKVLQILKRKTIKSLKGMLKKWEKASRNNKIALLDHLPALAGTPVRQAMDNFLPTIKALDFYNKSDVTTLPSFLDQLENLKYIKARYCAIDTLPITALVGQQMTTLNLIGNQIDNIPTIDQPSNISIMVLAKNQLKEWNIDVATYLPKLEELYLHNNALTSFEILGDAQTTLRILSLNNNKLDSLSDTIAQLEGLEELHLTNNNLTEIPATSGQLSNLKFLSLAQNPIAKNKEAIQALREQLPDCVIIDSVLEEMPLG